MNKRALSLLSWKTGRRREHDPMVFAALVEAAAGLSADQVAVTGDLTHLGLPAEFDLAREHLNRLGPPGHVFVVPGNHDALVAARGEDPFAVLADYSASDSPPAADGGRFPSLRARGRIALIGVSTAHPTRPLSAAGSVGPAQLARLATLLDSCGRNAMYRVVLIHHPPLSDGVPPHKRLLDAGALRSVVERHGAELILHGHTHRCSTGRLPGRSGPVPVFGISSGTAVAGDRLYRAVLRVFRIRPDGPGWRTTLQDHGYDPAGRRFLPEPEHPVL